MQKSIKLFFIYVAKEEEWRQRQSEDWDYVSSLSRFFTWPILSPYGQIAQPKPIRLKTSEWFNGKDRKMYLLSQKGSVLNSWLMPIVQTFLMYYHMKS